ncbi:MAG TPA: amidohydrolase family protein [Streptosporangiaceae bacterium]
MTFDVLLAGGWVVDGTGTPPWRADVGIRGNRIAAAGRLGQAGSGLVLDVSGRYIFPGFIDTHIHADLLYPRRDVQEAALRQGVTTLLAGQDGLSCAPAPAGTAAYVRDYFGPVNGFPGDADIPEQLTVAGALRQADGAAGVNVAWLVPAGTVRHQVMGSDQRKPTPAELAAMQAVVAEAMADGAVGLSTGLDYLPGRYADAAEIAALCEPAAEAGGVYVTHMRASGVNAWRGIAEVCEIAGLAGIAAHVSHYAGPATMLTRLVDGARDRGVDMTFDSYPYLRAATILAMVALPDDVQQGGVAATVARLRDSGVRETLCRDWFPSIADTLDEVTLAFVADPGLSWAEGMTLADGAARAGCGVGEFICDVLARSELAVGCVRAGRPSIGDEDIRAMLRHEAHMGGSDGIFVGSVPHPRGWGTFARYLGRHVRELGDWTWGQASSHLAGHAARRFGLPGRGLVREGYAADLAVLDPQAVADRATYADPRRPATGVSHVLVGGTLVLRDGELTGATPGRGLRRGADPGGGGHDA